LIDLALPKTTQTARMDHSVS